MKSLAAIGSHALNAVLVLIFFIGLVKGYW
jgi:hypothetical protein